MCKLRTFAISMIAVLSLLPFAIGANADSLSHSGVIVLNTTWLSSDDHTVTGDVTVSAGVTLTIEAGVAVQFVALSDDQTGGAEASLTELIVEGELIAEGSDVSPIVFTSNATIPAVGDWGGIRQSGGGDLTLRYVTIEYAAEGMRYEADGGVIASAVVENTTVHDLSGTGLYFNLTNGAVLTLAVSDNVITDVGGHGVFGGSRSGSSLTVVVSNNQLQNIGNQGVYLYTTNSGGNSSLDGTVTGNTVTTTGQRGFYFYSNTYQNTLTILADNNTLSDLANNGNVAGIESYLSHGVTLTNNNLSDMPYYGIYVHQQSVTADITVSDNTVSSAGNYGIYVYPYQNTGTFTLNNNTVSGARTYGIYLRQYYNTATAINVVGNTASGVVDGHGIYAQLYSANQGAVLLADNIAHDNEREGINLNRYQSGTASTTPVIRNNQTYNNGSDGSYNGLTINWSNDAGHQEPEISLNRSYSNTKHGLGMTVGDGVEVVSNDFHDNVVDGIRVNASGIARIHENNLDNNTGFALFNNSALAVAADNNWWGASVSSEMATGANPKNISALSDIYDDGSKGTISYVPWLSATTVLTTDPVSWLRLPADGAALKGPAVTIEGSASAEAGIDRVEVSTDNGVTWSVADGTLNWSYSWSAPADGIYQLRSRVITLDSQIEAPSVGNTLTIDGSLPTTSGFLAADETWSGTVAIIGDITVPVGSTLTIEPGTRIEFQALNDDQGGGVEASRPELIVEGSLVTVGTELSPIVFTSNATIPAAGDWGGIRQTSGADLTLQYVTIEYATQALEYIADGGIVATVVVEHTTVSNASKGGVYVRGYNGAALTVTMSNNSVTDVGLTGLFAGAYSGASITAVVSDNQLQNIGNQGVYLSTNNSGGNSSLDGTVTGNTVTTTGQRGFYFYSNTYQNTLTILADNNTLSDLANSGNYAGIETYFTKGVTVTNNDLSDTTYYGIYVYQQSVTADVDVSDNTVTSAGSYGLYVYPNSNTGSLMVNNNTVTSAGSYGLYVYPSSNTGSLMVNNNTVIGAGTYGIYLRQYYGTANVIDVVGNSTSGVVNGHGIYAQLYAANQGAVIIADNIAFDNERQGISLQRYQSGTASVTPIIRNNQTYNNGSDGSYNGMSVTWSNDAGHQEPEISLNQSYGNTKHGLGMTVGDGVEVVYNDFYGNGGDGVRVNAGGIARIHENNLQGNTGFGLFNNSASAVAADNNWWGASVASEMAVGANPKNISALSDIYDDSTKGTISYVPWLGVANVLSHDAISWVRLPADGAVIKGPAVTIEGSASAEAGIDRVEVSTDNGITWSVADGTLNWSYAWSAPADGGYQLRSRVITLTAQTETPGVGNTLTIDSSLPTTSGFLAADETWSGTVAITGDITVPVGSILTIEPGTRIEFQALNDDQGGGVEVSRPELIVQGSLVTVGTELLPIVFTSNATIPAAGDWGGIRQTGGADLTLQYATVEYATQALEYIADGGIVATVVVEHTTVSNATQGGVYVRGYNGAALTVAMNNNAVTDVGLTGLFVGAYSGASITAVVSDNQLQNIGNQGVYLSTNNSGGNSSLDGTVTGNTVTTTGQRGFYFYSNTYQNTLTILADNNTLSDLANNGNVAGIESYLTRGVTLTNNNLSDMPYYGIYVSQQNVTADITVSDNTVSSAGNYGIYVYPYQNAGTFTLNNNTVSGARTYGIYLQQYYNTATAIDIVGNTVSGVVDGLGIYARLYYANQGAVLIADNSVHDNERGGISLYRYGSGTASATPVIRNNQTYNNGSDGSYNGLSVNWSNDAGHQDPEISLNRSYGNTKNGLGMTVGDGVEVVYNDFYDNGGDGVRVNAGGIARIHENNLQGNTGFALFNNNAVTVAADNNWWGASTTGEMAVGANPKNISALSDIYDDNTKGTISYVPWLGAANVLSHDAISWVRLPADGTAIKGPAVTIEGSASAEAGIDRVEVSTDNGITWSVADGTLNWSYDWSAPGDGGYQLRSRVITLASQIETPGVGNTLTIDSSLPTTSGTLAVDETWSGTVAITGDITVPVGSTLTIEPGTRIEFQALNDDQGGGVEASRPELIVQGSLVTVGTELLPIVFTSNATIPAAGDWGGIRQTGGADLTLQYATVEYATQGLEYIADGSVVATVEVDHVTVSNSTQGGLYVRARNSAALTVTMSNNSVADMGYSGVFVGAYSGASITAVISDNELQNIGNQGIYLSSNNSGGNASLDGTVTGNTVTTTGQRGFYFYSNTYQNTLTILADNNTLSDLGNSGNYTGIESYLTRGVTLTNNNLSDMPYYGIYVSQQNVTADITVSDNTVTSAGNYGIYVYPYQNAGTFTLSNNTVSGARTYGIYLQQYYNTATAIDIVGNIVSGVVDGLGIYARLYAANQGPVLIADNMAFDNERGGINLHRYQSGTTSVTPIIRNNQTYNNGSDGSYNGLSVTWSNDAGHQDPDISLNRSYGNTNNGLGMTVGDGVEVVYNDFHDNGGDGVRVNASGIARIHENNLLGNSGFALFNNSAVAVAADHNWWGVDATTQMSTGSNPQNIAAISDVYDDNVKGTVAYLPWLGEANTLAQSPISWLRFPASGSASKGPIVVLEGSASAEAGIDRVEVSTDNASTWQVAEGGANWTYHWDVPADDSYQVLTRVVAADETVETPSPAITLTIDSALPVTGSGTVTQDETWSGNVTLTGDITIPEGVTVTIEAGANITVPRYADSAFGGYDSNLSEIIVDGNLLIQGTIDNPVVIAPSQAPFNPGDWRGIVVRNGSLDAEYLTIRYAKYGVVCQADAVAVACSLANSTIEFSELDALYFSAFNAGELTVDLTTSEFSSSSRYGMYLQVSNGNDSLVNLDIIGSTFDQNAGGGLYLYANGSTGNPNLTANVSNSIVSNNVDYGIYVYTTSGATSNVSLTDNAVQSNIGASGIYFNNSSANAASVHEVVANDISDNRFKGVRYYNYYSSISPTINNNTVYDNIEEGLHLTVGNNSVLLPILAGNTVVNNSVGLFVGATGDITAMNNEWYDNQNYDVQNNSAFAVNAQSNWWGVDTTNGFNINPGTHPRDISVIYDQYDDAAKGLVDYSSWLSIFQQPLPPTVDAVTTPVILSLQTVTGAKPANTGIEINGVTVVPVDALTSWSHDVDLLESINSFAVKAINAQGLVSDAIVVTIARDTTAPRVISSYPFDGALINQFIDTIQLTLYDVTTDVDMAASLASAGLTLAEADVPGSWQVQLNRLIFTADSDLTPGDYVLSLDLVDSPLANATSETISFTVDTVAPTPIVLNAVLSPTNVTTQLLAGSKEADTSIWINGLLVVPNDATTIWQYNYALQNGVNELDIYALDLALNISTSINVSVTLDTVAPGVVAVLPAANSYSQIQPQSVRISLEDDISGIDQSATSGSASLNGGSGVVPGSWSFEPDDNLVFTPAGALAEDTYSVVATITDLAGNMFAFNSAFTYDATAPPAPVVNPVESPANNAEQTLSGTKEVGSGIVINNNEVISPNESSDWSYDVFLGNGNNAFAISARDKAGNQSPNTNVSIVYDDVAPLPVDELAVSSAGDGTFVTLDWSAYDEGAHGDVAGYFVYVETDLFTQTGALVAHAVLSAGTQQLVVDGLLTGQTYYFAVVAVDNNGNRNGSVTPIAASPNDAEAPEDPADINFEVLANGLQVQWSPSPNTASDLSEYRLYVDDGAATVFSSATLQYQILSLNPATSYQVRVSAVDTSGNESAGVVGAAVTLLPNPTGLAAVPLNGRADVSWSVSSPTEFVQQYAVYAEPAAFTTVEGLTPKATVGPGVLNYRVNGLVNDVPYYFSVTTINVSNGENKLVSTVMATPILQGPTFIAAAFDDVDGSGGLSVGDRYRFSFSEAIEARALSDYSIEANQHLLLGLNKRWGNLNRISWNVESTEVTVEITSGFNLAGNETVSTSDLVTDLSGNPVINTIDLSLIDTVAPQVKSMVANFISPIGATELYQLTVQFDSSMNPTIHALVSLTSSGVQQPVVPTGEWLTTFYPNDTYIADNIVLAQGMDGQLSGGVSIGQDVAGNVMSAAVDIFSAELDATPPLNPLVTVSGQSCNSATLDWNGYAGAADLTGFQVYQATDGAFSEVDGHSFVRQLSASSRSVEVDGLSIATAYEFAVTAADYLGNYTSTVVSHSVQISEAIPATVGITVGAGANPNEAVIDWSAYDSSSYCGFAGFYVYVENGDFISVLGLTPVATLAANQQSYTLVGLDRSQNHYIAVVGFSASDQYFNVVTSLEWQDPYAGDVTANTTIGGGEQKIIDISETITVANDATLTIASGSELRFAPGTGIVVLQGTLNLQGTVFEPVLLTSANAQNGSATSGDWAGLTLTANASGSSLAHVVIEYGEGLTLDGVTTTIEAFTARHNSGGGLTLRNGANLTTTAALLRYNDVGVIVESGANLTLSQSVIKNNGINAQSDGSVTPNLQSNWWGSLDETTILASLNGTIDSSNFLSGEPVLSPAISTADGATQVVNRDITLWLPGRNAEEMRISEDASFSNVFFNPWQAQPLFELSDNGGEKIVYAQLRSITGAASETVSVTLNYVTDGPVISNVNLSDGQTISRPVTVTADASALLGLGQIELLLNDALLSSTAATSLNYAWDPRSLSNGIYSLIIRATDLGGHVTQVSRTIIIDLAPADAPVITSPINNSVVSTEPITIQGSAEPGVQVQVRRNGFVVGTPIADANTGAFVVPNVSLPEGDSDIVATATDSVGISAQSETIRITLDTGAPAAVELSGVARTGQAGIDLVWSDAELGEAATAYSLYRATAPFTDSAEAQLLTSTAITTQTYLDTPSSDGTYYYGVVGEDSAGNFSALSNVIAVEYDRSNPQLTISYDQSSPVGPGTLEITVTSDEALLQAPSLTLTPAGSQAPQAVILTAQDEQTFVGSLEIDARLNSGVVTVKAVAVDQFGNQTTATPSGTSLSLDTRGPVAQIQVNPAAPVQIQSATDLTVSVTLDEPMKDGSLPVLQLATPAGGSHTVPLIGSGSSWSGSTNLDSGAGDGFGTFTITTEDALGNIGTAISSGATVELYTGALPTPAGVPEELTAQAQPGGGIALTWSDAANADNYNVYRRTGDCGELPADLVASGVSTLTVLDTPPSDGNHCYIVRSNRRGAESDPSPYALARADRIAPNSPQNLAVILQNNGVAVSWAAPGGEVPSTYELRRNGNLVRILAGGQATYNVDDHPGLGGSYQYTVVALDAAGNSATTAPETLALLVGAVSDLNVIVMHDETPSLAWISNDPSVVGYEVYSGANKLHSGLLIEAHFADVGYAGQTTVTYGVVAVDGSDQRSPMRHVTVYPVQLNALANTDNNGNEQPLLANTFSRFEITVDNLSIDTAITVNELNVEMTVNAELQHDATRNVNQSIAAQEQWQQDIIIPIGNTDEAHLLLVTAIHIDVGGSRVDYQRPVLFENVVLSQDTVSLSLDDVPLAGGISTAQLCLNNSGYTAMEVVVAREQGQAPGDVFVSIRDGQGLEIARGEYDGIPPGAQLRGDDIIISLAPNEQLCVEIQILIPEGLTAGTELSFVGSVAEIQLAEGNQILTAGSGGLINGRMVSGITQSAYYGVAQADQAQYSNNETVTITGQAINRLSGLPEVDAPIKLGFETRGYTWFEALTTDSEGDFSFTYTPTMGLSGQFQIWAAHPDVFDTLNQDSFSFYRVYTNPARGDIRSSKADTLNFEIDLINPSEDTLDSLSLSFRAYTVDGDGNEIDETRLQGALDIDPDWSVAPGESGTVKLSLSADIDAPTNTLVEYTLTTGQGASATFEGTVNLSEAIPLLDIVSPTVGYVDTSLTAGATKTVPITVTNEGLRDLEDALLTLPQNVTWMRTPIADANSTTVNLGTIPVGESVTFDVLFTPPGDVAYGYHEDSLTISGSNSVQDFTINVYALISSSEEGSVQFNVFNILGQEVPNARIRLWNNTLGQEIDNITTDAVGQALVEELKLGDWGWQVIASGHQSATGTIRVEAEQIVEETVELNKNLVTINFNVVPVPYTDKYEIVIEQTFETHVPKPNIIIDPTMINFKNVEPGFSEVRLVGIKNVGLKQANDVNLYGADTGELAWIPLVTYLPKVDAMDTVYIPYQITYRGEAANDELPESVVGEVFDGVVPVVIGGEWERCYNQSQEVVKDAIKERLKNIPLCTPITYDVTSDKKGIHYTPRRQSCIFVALSNPCDSLPDFDFGVCDELDGLPKIIKKYCGLKALCGKIASAANVLEDGLRLGAAINCTNWSSSSVGGGDGLSCHGLCSGGGSGGELRGRGPGIRYHVKRDGGTGCFVSGTPIQLSDGSLKRIEDVVMGDRVLGFDGQPAGVTKVYTRETDHLRELRYRNVETGQLRRVETTDEHLYWVQNKAAWIRAGNLVVGDVFALADGFAKVEVSQRREIDTVVYNFDVEGLQSYYANGALVYQQCGAQTDPAVTQRLLETQSDQWQQMDREEFIDFLSQPATGGQ